MGCCTTVSVSGGRLKGHLQPSLSEMAAMRRHTAAPEPKNASYPHRYQILSHFRILPNTSKLTRMPNVLRIISEAGFSS